MPANCEVVIVVDVAPLEIPVIVATAVPPVETL
jgi:hypothetical protein